MPYVRQDSSFLRLFYKGTLDHPHEISEDMFRYNPKKKFTFLKTHTHYAQRYEQIAFKYNLKIIISVRDLRGMLLSRYFHILSDKKHWMHNQIKNQDFKNGFIKSISFTNSLNKVTPLEYYYFWISDWIKISKQRDYLVLWYEDYVKNPTNYIKKILDYLEIKNEDPGNIENIHQILLLSIVNLIIGKSEYKPN